MNTDLDTVRLGDVARVAADERVSMTASERQLHAGPYPLYAENCTVTGIDDYALPAGGTVMVGAIGQIISSTGFLVALYEPGRCSASEHVHAVVPRDPADGRYLWRVLGASARAPRLVAGTSQLRQLSAVALANVGIPWPERPVRDAFADALDAFDRRSQELTDLVPALLAEGDAAFQELVMPTGVVRPAGEVAAWRAGTNVPAADRGPAKPVRIEGPHGRLGRCDEALACDPVVVVGPASRRLLSHYVGEPSHPIAEMGYVDAASSTVPLSVLLFALRAAGALDRVRLNGQMLEAPQLTLGDLPALPLTVGTPEAQAAFDAVAAPLLEHLAETERAKDALAAERYQVVRDFMDHGLWEGAPIGVAPLPEPRAPEAALDPEPDGLGALASLVREQPFGLEPADLAWELAPLAALRAVATPEQWASLATSRPTELVAALDAVMEALAQEDDLLSFLPNLSYASSLLAPEQLAQWVAALDAIDPQAIDGAAIRAAFALEPGDAAMPSGVVAVVEAVIESLAPTLPPDWETAYVPWESRAGMVDLLGRVAPAVTLRAQFADFAPMLAAALVRAVDLRAARAERGGLGAAPGNALAYDEFADWRAPLVLAALPANAGAWQDGAPQPDDPRWAVLGVPPRNKANYAWLQHALSHQEEGGATVLLVADAVLHTKVGSERALREALAASGRVRAVVAFPAHLFEDGQPASALLVLGDPRPAEKACCLMVNALDLGRPVSGRPDLRALAPADTARIADACRGWLRDGHTVAEPGFACVVDASDLAAHDGVLTPWTYA